MINQDFLKAVAATLERGGSDLDASLPMVRARLAVDVAARAALPQWKAPPKPDFAARIRQEEEFSARRRRAGR